MKDFLQSTKLFFLGLEIQGHLLQEAFQVKQGLVLRKCSQLQLSFFSIDKGSQADQNVATIQQMMSSYLKKEEDKVEENILRYTEQQQATLSALETRVRQDRNTLLL